MRGTAGAAPSWWQSYDVEPYNRYPRLLTAGEPVYVTEKIHGTCGVFGRDGADESRWFVSSKGHSDAPVFTRYLSSNHHQPGCSFR
jgi:hypothetical protein